MLGICWFVQIVHYPLFKSIDQKDFINYQKQNWVTGYITGPVMIIELITGLLLWYHIQDLNQYLNVGLLGITGLSTVFIQIPIHLKL